MVEESEVAETHRFEVVAGGIVAHAIPGGGAVCAGDEVVDGEADVVAGGRYA